MDHDVIQPFNKLREFPNQLVELFLGLEHTLKLLVSFFLFALILSLEDLMLAFGLTSVPLNNIVVIVRPFKCGLHAGKLVLHSIELHTSLFALLADLAHGLLAFAKFQVNTLVLIRQLFRQSVLQSGHQRL